MNQMPQMNQMNVPGMTPGVGGPVGGTPMMNNGSTAPRNDGSMMSPERMIDNLNTYIYDYFLRRGYHDCARALLQDESIKVNTDQGPKPSPGTKREDMNGMDGDVMMTDGKDGEKIKIPDDLPRPSLPSESLQSSFLLDWFSLFWEFFLAQRKRGSNREVSQYLQHTQNAMRIREQQQNQLLRQQPLMPGQMSQLNMRGRNGMMPQNLQKTVLQNNTNLNPQQMASLQQKQQMQMMAQMSREQSDMDMNGARPQSPASADNAPSPSKRPRIEGGPVNGQQIAPNGRQQGPGMQGQPNPQAAMMMQNGMGQRPMNPAQFQQFTQGQAAQQKSMQGMPNGAMMNPNVMPNQGDLVTMPDGQSMYPPNGRRLLSKWSNGSGSSGKTRWPAAKANPRCQASCLRALPPQGSRAGASPNPSEQMKRGTPKMPQTGLPGSPSAGDMNQNRGSPGSMNLNGGQMQPDMSQFFNQGAIRPPSSNPAFSTGPMGQAIPANAGRMPNGQWPPGSMPSQSSPANQPQAGTPQQEQRGGNMPPPQPPTAGAAAARSQPQDSPQTGNAPPTPQPQTKAAGKKKEPTRKRPQKKNTGAGNAAGATPVTEPAELPTPTPSTPVTPSHPNSFKGPNGTASAPAQPTTAPAPPPMLPSTLDQNQAPFNDLGITDSSAFNLDFSALDNPDILESFDFDTFLNTDGETGFGFDPNLPYTDGVETGTGDQ
ncbi:Transcriptional activator somA [Penicillium chermesinum]|uniref:Transcriptional activator somA n=1 Tax=Penicillium chermesinum TaxID=63820 RepID=A0A9W9TJI3_9EURO|nr:Transcriptional activator somA [Penicillium chermesinum]KAJ5225096.1 Transcriptional activator somA [Penicillium chermesinum]